MKEVANLIDFDDEQVASAVMNASWDEPEPVVALFNKEFDFPVLRPVLRNFVNVSREVVEPSVNGQTNSQRAGATPVASSSPKPHKSATHITNELDDSKIRARAIHTPAASIPVPTVPAWTDKSKISAPVVSSTPIPSWEVVRPRAPATALSPIINSVWDTNTSRIPASTTLFPKIPLAVAPPAALSKNLSLVTPAKPVYEDHDPDNPTFNAALYYNKFAQGFTCPQPKGKACKKPLGSASALIAHLRSAAHKDLEPQTCFSCNRPFPNATALTQHVESQAVKCSARKSETVGDWVESFTQFAVIAGSHADDTNIYKNRSDIDARPGDIVMNVGEAGRRAVNAQVDKQENLWKDKEYDNW